MPSRVILNEFLERLADPLPDEETKGVENAKGTVMPLALEERLKGFHKPAIGLPVYHPDILAPNPEHWGSLLVSHTLPDPSFLEQLLAIGRRRGVKGTGILPAAVYEISDSRPTSEATYNSGSPMNLRSGHLQPEYCDRTKYVNSAVTIQHVKVLCNLFQKGKGDEEGFWKAAKYINEQWDVIKMKKNLAKMVEAHVGALMEPITSHSSVVGSGLTSPELMLPP